MALSVPMSPTGTTGAAGLECEERRPGAPLVEAPVGGTGALRVQRDSEALLEQPALLIQGIQRCLTGAPIDRDGADGFEERLLESAAGPEPSK